MLSIPLLPVLTQFTFSLNSTSLSFPTFHVHIRIHYKVTGQLSPALIQILHKPHLCVHNKKLQKDKGLNTDPTKDPFSNNLYKRPAHGPQLRSSFFQGWEGCNKNHLLPKQNHTIKRGWKIIPSKIFRFKLKRNIIHTHSMPFKNCFRSCA
jgi:hypothetical protein